MLTNDRIADAWLLVAYDHSQNQRLRSIRPLKSVDFTRLREAKKKVQGHWAAHRFRSKDTGIPTHDYHKFRGAILDRWAKEYDWGPETRNLYSSMLSKLGNWDRHGVSKSDQELLEILRPGAELLFRFLKGYQFSLV